MGKRGLLVILSGPSGVGKDTIISIITSNTDFSKFTTCTTRPPRPGEVNGLSYHFLDKDSFMDLYSKGVLLDNEQVSGHHYGLPLEDLGKSLDSGKNIIIHLSTGSTFMLKRIFPDAVTVFIMPPSHESELERLIFRGMSDEQITKRLRDDPTRIQAAKLYDFIVVNHDGEVFDTAGRILRFINQSKKNRSEFSLLKNSVYSRIHYMFPEFLATKNNNKLREFNEILADRKLEQISVELFEPQGVRVEDVVREKAEDAFNKTGKLVLVEDTSLEFEAWGGLPGALIKWFLDFRGNDGILKMLNEESNRKATAKTAIGFFDGSEAHVFVGEVSGTVPLTPQGDGGFGWDPIFIPDGYDKSFAQMTSEEKNSISMRRLALEQMKSKLSN
jgi:XTP/dITP diphosphohydrolase